MKYLYRKLKCEKKDKASENLNVEIFTPKVFSGLTLKGEEKNIKSIIVRFLFQLTTHGKAKIFYIKDNDKLVHTSYVIPKCYKFSFLTSKDYMIGPCFTYPEYRGKGIYPAMINYICNFVGTDGTVFYMSVDETNAASIRGIEKAGLERYGSVDVTGITKRYKPKKL